MSLDDTFASFVHTLTGKDVFVGEKPIGNNDCIVISHISNGIDRDTNDGRISDKTRFQVDIYHPTKAASRATANLLEAALDYDNTNFNEVTCENNFDLKDPELGLWKSVVEFFVKDFI